MPTTETQHTAHNSIVCRGSELPEKLFRHQPSPICAIKVFVETDEGDAMLLGSHVLIRVIEIQLKKLCNDPQAL